MLKGVDARQKINFVSKQDTEEPKTIFVLRPLTGMAMMDMSDMLVDGKMVFKGDDIIKMLDNSIEDIQNHPDMETMGKIEVIKHLEVSILTELMDEITKINNLSDSDKKKLK